MLVGQTSVSFGGAIVIVHWVAATPVTELPEESTTFAVKVKGPNAVGVPVIAPVVELSVRPVGRDPAMIENVYGGTPPLAVNAEL